MQPSESNTYADIEAVYQCLETEYGVSQEDLILYGQSVGSGPTLHLAAKLPRLRGVVLHSAILSGLRVLCHVKFTFCFDIYKVRSLSITEMLWISLIIRTGQPMKYQYTSVLPINSIVRLGTRTIVLEFSVFHSFMLFLLHFHASNHHVYAEHQQN